MHYFEEQEPEEPLIDTTAVLPVHSKRTQREQKKLQKKAKKHDNRKLLLDLPADIVLEVIGHLRPSDVFFLQRTSKSLHQFIAEHEQQIAKTIIRSRYVVMSKCFSLPVLLKDVEEDVRKAVQDEVKDSKPMKNNNFQHIISYNPKLICSCRTCGLAWYHLCAVLDFAHWQELLDQGTALPIIPRGRFPEWNQKLISETGDKVERALRSQLFYARILEEHLRSTVRSITRQRNNKGNKRKRFQMSEEDEASETDAFLERSGPPSLELAFQRDNYYMLEAYLPNRGWDGANSRWVYQTHTVWHNFDLDRIKNRFRAPAPMKEEYRQRVMDDDLAKLEIA